MYRYPQLNDLREFFDGSGREDSVKCL